MRMAYLCQMGIKIECDSCGFCQTEREPCPHCGEDCYEHLYEQDGEIIGCSECIKNVWRD